MTCSFYLNIPFYVSNLLKSKEKKIYQTNFLYPNSQKKIKMGYPIQSDIRSAIQIAAAFRHHNQYRYRRLPPAVISYRNAPNCCFTVNSSFKLRAFSTNDGDTTVQKVCNKPSLCTADELHYVSVNNSDWKLALWRYIPPPQVQLFFVFVFVFELLLLVL